MASSATNGKANGATAASSNRTNAAVADIKVEIVKLGGGKPDIDHHHSQLDSAKAEIDKLQKELDVVRAKLSGSAPAGSPDGQRRSKLLDELKEIREGQAGKKGSRVNVIDELKTRQNALSIKVKNLQASKSKSSYKSPNEIDAAIARLDAQIESGSMKLVDEKRALSEISNLRKSRKAVEAFAQQQQAIDDEKKAIDTLRAQLDDPQSRALAQRYEVIQKELDEIKEKAERSGESRPQLMAKRNDLQGKLDELYQGRRARQAAFRAENDAFQNRVRAEREKRNERYREEKRAEEDKRRKDEEDALREEAAQPAYAKDIEDCDVLIRYFSTKSGDAKEDAALAEETNKALEGVKPLELRKVNVDDAFAGATIAKKKGQDDDEEGYFVGAAKKGKGKGKKKGRGVPLSLGGGDDAAADDSGVEGASGKDTPLNVPLPTLTALLSLNIPPPTNTSDIARVIENLQRKKAYFISDQQRKTQENVDQLEKKLKSLNTSTKNAESSAENPTATTAANTTPAAQTTVSQPIGSFADAAAAKSA